MAIEQLGEAIPRIHDTAWVHPAATVIGDVEIGAGSSVWPCAVLRGDYAPIRVGEMTSIQDGAVLHAAGAGTFVGSRCIIGHLAFIEEATVEDACQIGVGARVLNGATVCGGAVVAAGAVLVKGLTVPPGTRAQGVPASVVPGGLPTQQQIERGAESYAELALRYRRELTTT